MKSEIIFQKGNHKWIVIGRDSSKKSDVIDTNEFVIISDGNAALLDPGGIEIFPQVLTELTKYLSTDQIKLIFSSHQDPDIASSLALWHDLSENIDVYTSWLWTGFLSHFGMGAELNLLNIPDEGMEVTIGDSKNRIYFVPAHYCHSSGNFSLYDPTADILFSGDIGAALLPDAKSSLFVDSFDDHIKYMDAFHKRWMPSTPALREWVRRVRHINPSMICPQHGSIFKGENVKKFLNWLDSIEVGNWDRGAEESGFDSAVWMKWK